MSGNKKDWKRRYDILVTYDGAKIKAELGEDYANMAEIDKAVTEAFGHLSAAENRSDKATAEKRLTSVGRPKKQPGDKRQVLRTTVAPETLAAIQAEVDTNGESQGQVIDRWADMARENQK